MRTVAAIPAVAILAGSSAGLLVPDIPRSIPLVTMVAACVTAVVVRRRDHALIACVVVGFAAGGQTLAADAWNKARSSTLRKAFDDAAAIERVNAEAEHRIVPEEASVFAVVEGVLRSDAAVAPSGVSLSIDVLRISPPMNIGKADVDEFARLLDRSLAQCRVAVGV